jgi:hypothetical protein
MAAETLSIVLVSSIQSHLEPVDSLRKPQTPLGRGREGMEEILEAENGCDETDSESHGVPALLESAA